MANKKKPAKPDDPVSSADKAARPIDKRVVAGVAGIAVGSAAIAAALLFANRPAKPKAAPHPEPPMPKVPDRPREPSAADIDID